MDRAQLLQSILNSVSEGVMTIDRDWRILSWNRAAEKITGFHKEEVIGQECSTLFRSNVCREQCPVDKALSCGRPYQDVEVAIRNKNNNCIYLLVNAAPLYDPTGNIIGGLETFRDVSQNRWMLEQLEHHLGYDNIVGRSRPMIRVFEKLASLLDKDTTVLIQGESGTGKELVARALHFHSVRKDKSFVALNCSAIPEGLLESELFGHAKGAFTGAGRSRVGKFELANGGTLFLDEIAEISQAVQVKLLRVLEEREFTRVGDNRKIKIDVRLVAATNKNLYQSVLDGAFREDLYYRLSVYPLDLPPLRERRDDIPLLVNHFIERFNLQMGKRVQGLADGVLDALEGHSWPGNVRELANALEHAFVHAKGVLILVNDLPERILRAGDQTSAGRTSRVKTLDDVEREMILHALRESDWNRSKAAKRLGMSRSTLWRKMERFSINP